MKSIYQYRDFRKFLQDGYLDRKGSVKGFTYASFAKSAGVASPNYLKLVIDGKRGLTPTNIQSFAQAVGLMGLEVDFFEALVLENQAQSPREHRYYRNRLLYLKRNAPKCTVKRRPTNLIQDVLHLALQLCAQGRTEEEAITLAVRELGILRADAERTLNALKESNELVSSGDGRLEPKAVHSIMHDPRGISEYQRSFLRAGLVEASEVFNQRYPAGAAKFLSLLLTAPEGSLPNLFAAMKSAAEKLAEDCDPPSSEVSPGVYRLQVHIYRLVKNED